jgi:hypothetical protein
MPRPQRLISESLHVIRKVRARYRLLAVPWSMGKDSDAVSPHLCRARPVERSRPQGAGAPRGRPLAEASLLLPAQAGTPAGVPSRTRDGSSPAAKTVFRAGPGVTGPAPGEVA